MIRVALVDDQALVRRAFSLMLSVEDDLELVGQAADGQAAVELATATSPHVMLMDIEMPRMNGLEATRAVRAAGDTQVIILTTFDRDDYLFEALDAGAAGFLLKNCEPERLLEAIRTVADGGALLAPEVTRRVIEQAVQVVHHLTEPHPAVARLTQRELDVLAALAQGLSNAEIARDLYVSEATVKSHVSSCLAKLGVRDRVQAVIFAFEHGLTRSHPKG
ncbi:response regulator transcription factor [Tessaracoccus sp. MC1865]|uniref:response regulator n=1 Tax=unclassified Tessaracoccus TaxID=2635419 RepID=UPI0016043AA5|nr:MULTISPECIES: response regulator transcription factor [unclassified Tessaracoccus]MBB1483646.1 response regulator transcription factor [Tessaracoccus sp. MC1865]MBB1508844.1 response regulator transcription factor [Tessaracoccus sp. MC1756]QTO36722.1 response regulator transcription factor [Tessaracoccus sp. MC1865]